MSEFEKSNKTPRTPSRVPFQTRTRARVAAEDAISQAAIAATITNVAASDIVSAPMENQLHHNQEHQTCSNVNPTHINPVVIDLDMHVSTDESPTAAGVLPTVTDTALTTVPSTSAPPISDTFAPMMNTVTTISDVPSTVIEPQPTLLQEALLQLNEANTQLDIYQSQLKRIEADRETQRQRCQQLEMKLQHYTEEKQNLTAELRMRDAQIFERQRIVEGLQAEQASLQQQFTQLQQRLNQMSQNTISFTQTATNRANNNNNTVIQGDSLNDNSRTRIHTHNMDTVTPVELGLGYNLKPDTYDGTTPLHEYLNQFNLIAKANNWNDEKKMVALAASLRGKSKGVLNSYTSTETLGLQSLLDKLEARFGDHFGSCSYSLFQSRRQRVGEDLPTLAADIERLAGLAYPECSLEVRDKIACSQFIVGIFNAEVRETLQLEHITSLKVALARASEVKAIKEQNRNAGIQRNIRSSQNTANSSYLIQTNNTNVEKQGQPFNHQEWLKNVECFGCHKKGHIRAKCPEQGN